MKIDFNYRISLLISSLGFFSKSDIKITGRDSNLGFLERVVDVREFLGLATSGHVFRGLYYMPKNGRYQRSNGCWIDATFSKKSLSGCFRPGFMTNDRFKSSAVVFVDIDDSCGYDIFSCCDKLRYKPTAAYYTFSDTPDKRKFRLVYIFSQQISKSTWPYVSRIIKRLVEEDTGITVDPFSCQMNQMFYGTQNKNVFCSGYIWDIDDFNWQVEKNRWDKTAREDQVKSLLGSEIDEDFEAGVKLNYNNFGKYDLSKFKSYWSHYFRYFYRTENDEWKTNKTLQIEYQETDDNFLKLWMWPSKLKDGQERRRTIGNVIYQLRMINPEASINDVIYSTLIWAEMNVELTPEHNWGNVVIERAKKAFSDRFDIDSGLQQQKAFTSFWKSNRPKFITRWASNYSGSHDENLLKKLVKELVGELNFEDIGKKYDSALTAKENAEKIGVSVSTIYRYRTSKGITAKTKQDKIDIFTATYNPDLSIRDNIEALKNNGLNLSRGSVANYIKKYYKPVIKPVEIKPEPISIPKDQNVLGSFLPDTTWENFNNIFKEED